MIHIYVCDDSAEFRDPFCALLAKLAPECFTPTLAYKIENGVAGGEKLLEVMESEPVDVIFLDIDMPVINGFELAKRITAQNKDAVVVFVSGYDHYVYRVFEFFPFAFLRKSHIAEELPDVLKRISGRFDRENKTISLNSVDGTVKFHTEEITYICSQGNYYVVYTNKGSCKCRGTLSEIEELVCGFDFYRIHSAYIVNLNHIRQVGRNEVLLKGVKVPIPIAQRRLAGFRAAYSEFTIRSFNL